jgi:hypothetical protein
MKFFYSSPWIPAEWIEAHGLQPCGVWFAEDLDGGAVPLSAGVCAFSEAVLRFAETHHDSVMIFTTACDQMRRSFDVFAGSQPARAFLFNLPATWQSPAAGRIFRAEVERLGRFLQAHGGRTPTAKDLAQIIERRSQTRKQLLELAPRCSARQYAEAIARFHWDGSVRVPDHPPPPASRAIPLAIVGGPLTASQRGLLDLIEAAGTRIVLNATESGERSLTPFSELNDSFKEPSELPEGFGVRQSSGAIGGQQQCQSGGGPPQSKTLSRQRLGFVVHRPNAFPVSGLEASPNPLDFFVRGYFENIVDVFQRPNTRLFSWLGERLTARGVRGIVLWIHTGCDLWRAEAQTLRETFRLPVLLLEADETLAGSPREAGRIQAFVEMLK